MSELLFEDTSYTSIYSSQKLTAESFHALTRKALFPWITDALLDWGVIAGALYLFASLPNPLTFIFAVLVLGNRQHALTVLAHDGAHFCLSANHRLNDFLTNILCFFPLGISVSGYRALHNMHHKFTGTIQDPELAHKRMRSPQWDLPANRWAVLKYALLDLVGGSIQDYMIIVKFSKPSERKELAYLGLYHLLLTSTLVALGLWWAAAIWYLALVTSFMMFFRLRLWLEHQNTADTLRVQLSWWQAPLLSPHNAFYHDEHHRYPTIPYHRLPEAREILRGEKPMNLLETISSFEMAAKISSGEALKENKSAM